MIKKFLLLSMLAASVACSGQRDDEVGSECLSDAECLNGGSCENGYCEGEDAIDPQLDGGATVEAAIGVAGAPAGTVVEVETDGCRGPSCVVAPGSDVTFRAPQVDGYRFTGWDGESPLCAGTAPELVLTNVTENIRCIANYVKRVNVSGSGEGLGASSDARFAECAGAACEVDQGSTVVITAGTREGFRFDGFAGQGCENVSGTSVTVVTGPEDVVCTAQYVATARVTGVVVGAEGSVVASSESPLSACDGGSCTVDAGGSVVLVAPALEDYRFAGWSGSEGCVGNELTLSFTDVTGNFDCNANYVARFLVSGTAAGANPLPLLAASSSDAFSQCSENGCEVDQGASVTLVAPSVPGYRFDRFTGDGCEGASGSSVTIADVSRDVRCVAHYVEGISVTGNVVGAVGTVTATATAPQEPCTNGTCIIDAGSNVRLVAPVIEGARFLGWSGAGPSDVECTGTSPTLDLVNVTQSKSCNANYVARLRIAGVANPTNAGVVTASSSSAAAVCASEACTVDAGSTVSLSAVASSGHRFTGWSGGGACTGTQNPLVLSNVTSALTCTASFVQRVTVAYPDPANGSVAASNFPSTANCGATSCVLDRGAALRLTATADANYRFRAWSGCSTSTNPVLDLTNITANTTCTANFVLRVRIAGVANPANAGAVTASSNGTAAQCDGAACVVDVGASVALSASTNTGFRFTGWSGGGACTGTANPLTIANVGAALTCTANFTRLVTVTYSAGSGGTVSAPPATCPNGSPCTLDSGTSLAITATPNTGFRFVSWGGTGCTDANNDTPNVADLGNVTANVTCVASFASRFTVTGNLASGSPSGVSILASSSSAGASCSGASCVVDGGSAVTLTASAAPSGYVFRGFSGTGCTDANPDANPLTLQLGNITANRTCTASYALRVTIRVTASPSGVAGTVTVSTTDPNASCLCAGGVCSSCTVDAGSQVTVTATESGGRRFSAWTGGTGCSSSDAIHAFTATASASCDAAFFALWARGYRGPNAGTSLAQGVLAFEDGTIGVVGYLPGPTRGIFMPRRMLLDAADGSVLGNTGTTFDHDAAWSTPNSGTQQATDIVGKTDSYVVLATHTELNAAGAGMTRPFLAFQRRDTTTFRSVVMPSTHSATVLMRGAQLDNGDYVMAGSTGTDIANGFIARVTESGTMRFAQTTCVANLQSACTRASCLPSRLADVEAIRGGFATLGYGQRPVDNTTRNILSVQRWNDDGSLAAEALFDPGFDAEPTGLVVTREEGYLIVGRVREPSADGSVRYNGFWIKLSRELRIEYMAQLGRDGFDDAFYEAKLSPDGARFVLAGNTYNVQPNGQGSDAWIVELDATTGALRQQFAYGTPGNPAESFSDLSAMPDGTWVAVGVRSNDGFMPLAMRLDEDYGIAFNATYRAELTKTEYEVNEKVVDPRVNCTSPVTPVDASLGTLPVSSSDPTENDEILAPE